MDAKWIPILAAPAWLACPVGGRSPRRAALAELVTVAGSSEPVVLRVGRALLGELEVAKPPYQVVERGW